MTGMYFKKCLLTVFMLAQGIVSGKRNKMAMLAEKRSKQKWSEDPRNINWSRDKDRYGYQMLEKMGWADGKGLGTKQNGKTSHVKIRKRKHNLGLGAKESHDQDWTAHQEDFNNLLSALHQHGGNAELRSEEQNKKAMLEVAKASRKRVFYKKFIRSKDTSQYSEKDLACIFGGTPSQSAPATPQKQSDDEVLSDDSSTSCPTIPANSSGDSALVTYTSKQNIHEYFARRMQELRGGGRDDKAEEEHGGSMEDKKECEKSREGEKELEGNKEDEKERERSIEDEKGHEESCQRSERKSLSEEKGDKKSKRKKRKEKEEEKVYVEVDEPKRKKKKKRTTINEENGLDALECLTNGACVDDVNASENLGDCAQVEVKRKESKKKKNRSKTSKENGLECLTNGECDSGEIILQTEHDGCSVVEIKRKKRKSRKKEKKEKKGNESNAAAESLTNEACVNGDSVSEKTVACSKRKVKQSKKKKAKKN